jgi:hypothetical protein
MKQYIHFFNLNKVDENVVEGMLEAFLQDIKHATFDPNTYIFNKVDTLDLKPLIQDMESETLSDIFAYVSPPFKEKELETHFNSLKQLMTSYQGIKKGLLTHPLLIKYLPKNNALKSFIFQKYANKPFMLETIKVYLESNQHAIIASQQLYIHRNTLLMRIESFYEVTMLDPRKFIEGYYIYQLL